MTHHDTEHTAPQGTSTQKRASGIERLFVRLLLLTMLALTVAAVVGSRDDIKRYMKIRSM